MTFRDVRLRGFRTRADVADVLAWVDGRPAPLPPETVPLADAAGRVLAEDLASPFDLPRFRRASMDGWAVRGAETFGATDAEPLTLPVVGDARTGRAPPGALAPGERYNQPVSSSPSAARSRSSVGWIDGAIQSGSCRVNRCQLCASRS